MARVMDEAEKLIADYLIAYRAANQKEPVFEIVYADGWFRFFEGNRGKSRHRKLEFINMTERLTRRAAGDLSDLEVKI